MALKENARHKVVVVGGGPAGMMAAIAAAEEGHAVSLYEKNEKTGKKLFITGKGRCNVTNSCDVETFLNAVCTNRKFLYSAAYGFTSQNTMDFFRHQGLDLKVERGNRVFPVSDHSSDVIAACNRKLRECHVSVHLHTEVTEILTAPLEAVTDLEAAESKKQKMRQHSRVVGIRCKDGSRIPADAVIVATGGISYRSTGSTGDGLRFAREKGHTVTELYPSLVPLNIAEEDPARMQGLSLRNVSVRIKDGKKLLYEGFGEMMFTHFGVTGPLILTASTKVQAILRQHTLPLLIDLKPALTEEQLQARFQRELEAGKGRQLKNVLGAVYPASMVPVILDRAELSGEKLCREVSAGEIHRLARFTKAYPLTITGTRDYNEAIVTRGGIQVKEIDPATMESRLVKGLYFAGEVLDLDAVTGGFNLQIAWSTGYAAGKAIPCRNFAQGSLGLTSADNISEK